MSNQNKFDKMYDRIFGALPNLPHRGGRLADLKDMEDLPWRILAHKVPWYGFDGKEQPQGQRNTVTLAATIGWLDSALRQLITGQAAILAAVKASSAQQGIDPAKLEQMIQDAIKESIGTYELRRVDAAKQSEEDTK